MKITRKELAGMIDHSLLKPPSTREELKKLCAEAVAYGFKAVCVNPVHVADAAALLKGESPLVCSVVGFSFGTHTPAAKAFEVAERVGYRSQHYFSRAFKKVTGTTPTDRRKGTPT